jgi:hypothetical protein
VEAFLDARRDVPAEEAKVLFVHCKGSMRPCGSSSTPSVLFRLGPCGTGRRAGCRGDSVAESSPARALCAACVGVGTRHGLRFRGDGPGTMYAARI